MPGTEVQMKELYNKKLDLKGVNKMFERIVNSEIEAKINSLPEEERVKTRLELQKIERKLRKHLQKEPKNLGEVAIICELKDELFGKLLELAIGPVVGKFFEKKFGSLRKEIAKPMRGGSTKSFKKWIQDEQIAYVKEKGANGTPTINSPNPQDPCLLL